MTTEELRELEMHDMVMVRPGTHVLRVPGGWIYMRNTEMEFVRDPAELNHIVEQIKHKLPELMDELQAYQEKQAGKTNVSEDTLQPGARSNE